MNFMYRRTPKSNKYLYHYTSPENFKLIMKGMSLRFNHYSNMNDPRESKYWSSSMNKEDYHQYIEDAPMKEKIINLELYSSFNDEKLRPFQEMKDKIQVLSFTMDEEQFRFGRDEPNAYLYRGFGNPYFWAHYGNSQKGVCLQFDKKSLLKHFQKVDADILFSGRDIKYNDEVHEGNPAFIRFSELGNSSIESIVKECIFENQDHYLFTKTTFWKPEREYRLALYKEDQEYAFLDITDSISSVILGEDIEQDIEREILEIGQVKGISVAKINWGNGYPTAMTISEYETNYEYD